MSKRFMGVALAIVGVFVAVYGLVPVGLAMTLVGVGLQF